MPDPITPNIDWNTAQVQRCIQAGPALPLARAFGLHKHTAPRIVDTTAGLGRDAYVLARLGARVHMLERHPAVAAALEQALAQAPDIRNRLTLSTADAIEWLTTTDQSFDAAYLDPMFADHKRAAKSKQAMQQLRALTGGDADSQALATAVWTAPIERIVIKRGPRAPALLPRAPTFVLRGNRARFDVFVRPEYRLQS